MLRRTSFATTVGVVVLTTASLFAQGAWKTVFDGKDLSQWNAVGNANWKIVDGAVQADMGEGFLVSKAVYGDFELRAEIWVSEKANSGIFIRVEDPKQVTSSAYEVNIFDESPRGFFSGAIVDVAKAASEVKAGGKWNTLEIVAKGSHFTIRLNGVTTVADAVDSRRPRGAIALQYGAGTVKFRKVEIRTRG